ncbi:MAG: HEAT repeat domain-containing protein, partial [Xenococcus sp. (in: cyanobacteria)]
MSKQVNRKRNRERLNLERRLQHLREQKATSGRSTAPEILMEIEDIEQELEQLLAEEAEVADVSPRKKISPNKLNKAREGYLKILEKDVKNRLETSIHNARFIDIDSEQSLDSTYLPWIYQGDEAPEVFNRFEEAFEQFERRVLLLGAPGSGKTTTLLHIAQQLIREAQADKSAPIPLLFNLSKFRVKDNQPAKSGFLPFRSQRQVQTEEPEGEKVIADWLLQMMTEYPVISRNVANFWLAEEKVALLLDGLDEVDDRQLLRLVDYLNAYLRSYPNLTVVVCSRIIEYQPLKDNKETRLQLEGAVTLQPLNKDEIEIYLETAEALGLRDALSGDQALYELAQSPLTLSVMTLAYGGMAPQDLPSDLSLVDRRRHLFDTYINRMMQRKARRDRGIPFDLNPDNDVPEREYPYTREQLNRYLGWLAVRLSERMQTVFPYDRLYSFVAQEPENKQNQQFWTEVKLANTVFIVLSIIAITILLMPKTLVGIKQAAFILSFLLPSSLFLGFVTSCTFSERFPNQEIIKTSMENITFLSIGVLIIGVFGGLVSSLAAVLPITISPFALGVIVAVIIAAIIHVVATLDYGDNNLSYLFVTGGSIVLPLLPALFNKSIAPLGIAASIVVAQWIFLVVIQLKYNGLWSAFSLSSSVVGGVALLGGLGITIIYIPDWYETIILLGLSFSILGFLEENSRPIILIISVLAALIGGFVANSIGSLVGATAVLAIIGLTFAYDSTVGKKFIEKTGSSIASPTDRFLYNLLIKFVLTFKRSMPANYSQLLNYVISALLLKRVGTEYEFIHRLLRDHFAIRELVPNLSDDTEFKEKIQSIERLSFQGDSAFDTLAELTQDQNPHIRAAAIEGLGRVAIPEVVTVLQGALKDSSIQVIKAVIKNLSKLPKKDSEMLLSKALQISGRKKVSELLQQLLSDRSYSVRSSAAEFLGQIGDSTAVSELIQALGDRKKSVRSSAA